MKQQEEALQRRLRRDERMRWLASSESSAFVSLSVLSVQAKRSVPEMREFFSNDSEFSKGYLELKAGIETSRAGKLQKYHELLAQLDPADVSYPVLSAKPEVVRIWKQLRDQGVRERWEYEEYLARKGGAGAETVLGPVTTEGFRPYTQDELRTVAEGGRPQVADPVTSLEARVEGHHVNSVSDALRRNVTCVESLNDPDNIRLMTLVAHRKHPTLGHGGSFLNPTAGEAQEVHNRFVEIREANRSGALDLARDREMGLSAAGGAVYGVLAGAAEMYRLRRDPRPWRKKAGLIAATSAVRGAVGFGTSLLTLKVRAAVVQYSAESAAELADVIGLESSPEVISEILGMNSGIAAVMLLRTAWTGVQSYRAGRRLGATARVAGEQWVVIAAEFGGFLLLGVLVDAVMVISDPTGLVVGARVAYGLTKLGVARHSNIRSQRDCLWRRMDVLYELACRPLLPN